jgi:hypothetical protein
MFCISPILPILSFSATHSNSISPSKTKLPSILRLALPTALSFALASATSAAYTITEPTSDTTVAINSTSVISWNTTVSSSTKVSLYLEKGSNSTKLYTIATDIDNSGSISWAPPSNTTAGKDYIIVLQPKDSSTTYSSSKFIISSKCTAKTYFPTKGDKIEVGETTVVTWPVSSSVDYVAVYLDKGTSAEYMEVVQNITTNVTNTESISCKISSSVAAGKDYKFAIVDANDSSLVQHHSWQFTVVNDESSSSSSSTKSSSGSSSSSASSSSSSFSSTSAAVSIGTPGLGWLVVSALLSLGFGLEQMY